MKGWVAACFALYIFITVPLLLAALVFMVRSLPRVIAGAVSSFGTFGRLFWAAVQAHEFLMAAATAAQVAILGLTVLGLLYVLGRVAFDVGRGLWRWGQPSAERRVAAVAGGTAMAALVVSLWLPQMPRFGGSADQLAARAAAPAMFDALSDTNPSNANGGERDGSREAVVASPSDPGGTSAALFRIDPHAELIGTYESASPAIGTERPAEAAPATTPVGRDNPAAATRPASLPAREGLTGSNAGPAATAHAGMSAPTPASGAGEALSADGATVAPTPVTTPGTAAPSDTSVAVSTVPAGTPIAGTSAEANLPGASAMATGEVGTTGVGLEAPVIGTAEADASVTVAPDVSTVTTSGLPEATTQVAAGTTVEPVVDTVASTGETLTGSVGGLLP
jgi:hypothetical protein